MNAIRSSRVTVRHIQTCRGQDIPLQAEVLRISVHWFLCCDCFPSVAMGAVSLDPFLKQPTSTAILRPQIRDIVSQRTAGQVGHIKTGTLYVIEPKPA
jgi:hypothetical protein